MNRLPEESQAGPSRTNEEGILPPLNLTLTITPEFIRSIDSIICPHQQNLTHQHNLTHQQNLTHYTRPPGNIEKSKPMHFLISEITIGQWTHKRKYEDDLKAKIYFKKRRLIWEILDEVQTETQVSRLKKKIEIKWSDILSFRATFNPHAKRETLDVELENLPTFFMETNPQAKKHSQWKEIEDFTLNQSASKFRRHTLHFLPGDLQQNLDQLVSGHNFWSKLATKRFPTLQHSIHFDVGYGDRNNNPTIQDEGETSKTGELRGNQSFAQDTQPNSMIYPNGIDDWLCLDGWMDDINPDDINMDNLSSYNVNNDIPNNNNDNPTIQEEGGTSNTGELRGSQAFAQDIQPNSMTYPNGLEDYWLPNMDDINMDDINLDDDCWKECSLPSL